MHFFHPQGRWTAWDAACEVRKTYFLRLKFLFIPSNLPFALCCVIAEHILHEHIFPFVNVFDRRGSAVATSFIPRVPWSRHVLNNDICGFRHPVFLVIFNGHAVAIWHRNIRYFWIGFDWGWSCSMILWAAYDTLWPWKLWIFSFYFCLTAHAAHNDTYTLVFAPWTHVGRGLAVAGCRRRVG